MKLEFLTNFRIILGISYFKELHPVRAELLHAEIRIGGQTDMTQLIVIFHNFENAPKKLKIPRK